MQIGPYAVTLEGLSGLALNVMDSVRVNLRGIPRLPGTTAGEIAAAALRKNARAVLIAGTGHFWFMWPSDFAKAYRGARRALDRDYLGRLIAYMIRESRRQGRVTSCFNAARGFDVPYYRGDNLPWLIYAAAEHGDAKILEEGRDALAWLLADYERTHFVDGLIDPKITGDWQDTILRPSSTYNNACALMMLRRAPEIGLTPAMSADELEARILERRWRDADGSFIDYQGADFMSVDAGVLALYLDLFPREVREAVADRFEASDIVRPIPMRCSERGHDRRLMPLITRFSPRYHSCIWLHLGVMYANGLERLGRDVSAYRKAFEDVTVRYGNVVETLEASGEPYRTWVHASEYGLTMAAGQLLELAASV